MHIFHPNRLNKIYSGASTHSRLWWVKQRCNTRSVIEQYKVKFLYQHKERWNRELAAPSYPTPGMEISHGQLRPQICFRRWRRCKRTNEKAPYWLCKQRGILFERKPTRHNCVSRISLTCYCNSGQNPMRIVANEKEVTISHRLISIALLAKVMVTWFDSNVSVAENVSRILHSSVTTYCLPYGFAQLKNY